MNSCKFLKPCIFLTAQSCYCSHVVLLLWALKLKSQVAIFSVENISKVYYTFLRFFIHLQPVSLKWPMVPMTSLAKGRWVVCVCNATSLPSSVALLKCVSSYCSIQFYGCPHAVPQRTTYFAYNVYETSLKLA